jgi:hypothetical protein
MIVLFVSVFHSSSFISQKVYQYLPSLIPNNPAQKNEAGT